MTFILLLIIAALLLIIGLLVHGVNSLEKECSGLLSWLTTKMGPGVALKPEKFFPGHYVWYGLSGAVVVLAFILKWHR